MEFSCPRYRLCPAVNVELAVDIVEMRFDRAHGDHELLSEVAVGPASGDRLQNLSLTLAEGLSQRL